MKNRSLGSTEGGEDGRMARRDASVQAVGEGSEEWAGGCGR